MGRFLFITFMSLFLSPGAFAQAPLCAKIFSEGESQTPAAFPTLHSLDLTNVQPAGRGNFTGFLDGKRVFIKRLRQNSMHEVRWLQRLNSLGLGVQFQGIWQVEKQTYMILEEAPGINTQMPMLAPESFVLTKKMVQEIKSQAKILAEAGIVPVDLQFQVDPTMGSVKIIDPELFTSVESAEAAQQAGAGIVRNLLSTWAIEGRLEQ